jgi:hypothetical protein
MSEQQTGGDGSVKWQIRAENVKQHLSNHEQSGALNHEGIDTNGECGRDWFTVSIKVPDGVGGQDGYLEQLRGSGVLALRADPDNKDRIYFNLPIKPKTHDQIQVKWGKNDQLPPDPNRY